MQPLFILGMGDKCAAEILKNMNPKEVEVVIEAINEIGNVSEKDVIKALNEFFKESNNNIGIDVISKENIKNSLVSSMGIKGLDGIDSEKMKWLDILKYHPIKNIVEVIQDEHPQIITALIVILTHHSSEKASDLMKWLPKAQQNQIIKRMTAIEPISTFAIDALSDFFNKHYEDSSKYNLISVDGVEAVANIISYLDSETEREIISEISTNKQRIIRQIQDKLFPFEKLSELDNKSLQILISETNSEDLALALKVSMNMSKLFSTKLLSTKAAEILKDDMEQKGLLN